MAELSITIKCTECGTDLNDSLRTDPHGNLTIDVDPCEKCLEAKYEDGVKDGRDGY